MEQLVPVSATGAGDVGTNGAGVLGQEAPLEPASVEQEAPSQRYCGAGVTGAGRSGEQNNINNGCPSHKPKYLSK